MEMTVVTNKNKKAFTSNLANAIWQISINNAPRDTGNLQRNITLSSNTSRKIGITYNAFNAPYLHYLEMGEGPIKKHKGFIGVNTVVDVMNILIKYVKGDIGIFERPNVKLEISRHGPMFSEKKLLKIMRVDDPILTADERMQLGQIYSRNKLNTNKRWSNIGEKAKLDRTYRRSMTRKFNFYYTSEELY